MIINTNIQAMSAARNFGINTKNKAKSAEKLSSGYSINRAADDAADLTISEKMRAQIKEHLIREPRTHRAEYHGFMWVRRRLVQFRI